MSFKTSLRALLVTGMTAGVMLGTQAAFAQGNVSVVHLSVQNGSSGQLVLTPKGVLVPLPGAGVNSNVVDIYYGANGGYWYVDRNGQTVDLTAYVQEVRSKQQQMQTAAPPQYAPYPSSSSSSSSSSSGSSALGTAAAAGVGAMVGSSMSHYNNVPYGTPMYYANGRPYYSTPEGQGVFVNDGNVQWNNVAKANDMQNYKQTQQIDQAKAYQQQHETQQQSEEAERQQAMQSNQKQRQEAYGGPSMSQQSQAFEKQQQWYQEQSQDKGKAQAWKQQSGGENPFARTQSGDSNFAGRSAGREAGADGFSGGARQGRGAGLAGRRGGR